MLSVLRKFYLHPANWIGFFKFLVQPTPQTLNSKVEKQIWEANAAQIIFLD